MPNDNASAGGNRRQKAQATKAVGTEKYGYDADIYL
jgi:hypothetical protein